VIVVMCRIGDPQVAALARRRVPAVLIPGDPGLPGVASVTFDVATPTEQAVRRLLDLGHRRVGFIGGAPADAALQAETNFTSTEACERALALLTRGDRPTAPVCRI
jgi:DNA-binding LacI/PurR family transcriptional regulator